MKRKNKMTPAQKAGATRSARVAFVNKYGQVAYDILRASARGDHDEAADIADSDGSWNAKATVAAYKANAVRNNTFGVMIRACNIGW